MLVTLDTDTNSFPFSGIYYLCSGDGLSGKFLERTQALRKGSTLYDVDGPKYLVSTDFQIGACVEINHYKFTLLEADEYTYHFMEKRTKEYPWASLSSVEKKIREKGVAKLAADAAGACGVSGMRYDVVARIKRAGVKDFTDHVRFLLYIFAIFINFDLKR